MSFRLQVISYNIALLIMIYTRSFYLTWSMALLFFLVFAGAIISAIYEEKKDEDGFLYVSYSGENTFGYEITL